MGWTVVEDGVQFMRKVEEAEDGAGESKMSKQTITLRFMAESEEMVENFIAKAHYFQRTLGDELRERIVDLVDGLGGRANLEITPARLEQLCAEHDEVDGLIGVLQDLAGSSDVAASRITLARTSSVNVEAAVELSRLQSVSKAQVW